MNFLIKQKQTHRHRKQIYGYQRERGEWDKLEVWNVWIQTTISKIQKQQGFIAQVNRQRTKFNIL